MSVSRPPKRVTNAYRKGWNEIFGKKEDRQVLYLDTGNLSPEKAKEFVDDYAAKIEVAKELSKPDRPLNNIQKNDRNS